MRSFVERMVQLTTFETTSSPTSVPMQEQQVLPTMRFVLASGTSGLVLNNNVYYFTGNGGVFGYNGAANVPNYAAGWAGGDLLSYETNPQFLAPNGSAFIGDLHINPSIGTLVEQTGSTIASVTEDFDGQIRASLSPNDIGADAGNFISLACTGTPTGGTPTISIFNLCR
ncbi:MAG: hypothetical protein IPL74_00890 [Bacteroidetes bacterium]|nr:hypothetical protein [Bacteroidota bacterium]